MAKKVSKFSNSRYLHLLLLLLAILGLADSSYLAYEHFTNSISSATCPPILSSECDRVLLSSYSEFLGIPLAFYGIIYYGLITYSIFDLIFTKRKFGKYSAVTLSTFGFFASLYFVYLQLIIIKATCTLCMASAVLSFLLFLLTQLMFKRTRKTIAIHITHFIYINLVKHLFFLFSSDWIHKTMTSEGQDLGKFSISRKILSYLFKYEDSTLSQKLFGIKFTNPVGLAAGFDYQAKLTQVLPSIGFGFASVGTVTYMAYEGNPPPRLGRLIKSRSLMVNKGFKSPGAKNIVSRLEELDFEIPIGISIGRTNSAKLKNQKQSIDDIIKAFKVFEKSKINHSYYELNISCPNLFGDITFYPTKNLEELLSAVDKLKITKPIFIKMPISKTNAETLAMLKVIVKHTPKGVIFGNLQTDRRNKAFDKHEVEKFISGNFSGKPTYKRSNELIKLAYKNYKDSLIVIGCGGIFNGKDAYEKIKLGASFVQLITGLVFEGPQLAAQINTELKRLLKKDGLSNISEAVGSNSS